MSNESEVALLVTHTHGHPMPTQHAAALLFGVSVEQFDAAYPAVPADWLATARRRQNEATAQTGRADVFSALAYWAEKDLGATIAVCGAEAILAPRGGVTR